ncbi:MAG: RsmD family RNA methyltransferase [Saprospiraceae bacterium]|jgi:16S rRNA (guanine(966)-N(2))-methyltransferase RsmD|nr:RsmD family RNA methyltransferase [Saprospiraceae bacterium]
MRIISGMLKGRRFNPPAEKWPTRPTTDMAKEGLFNILQHALDFESIKVLDLFGGTGSLSYEFISRGCEDVTYVDKFPACAKFVEQTAKQLDIQQFIKVVNADVFKFIERSVVQYDFIFADPPFQMPATDTLPNLVFERKMLRPGGWFVLEHNGLHDFEMHPRFAQQRHYGGTYFTFFEMPEEAAPTEA